MPELPEVETVRRGLLPLLCGRRIERAAVIERRLRSVVDPRRLRRANGRRIEGVTRRAKYLFLDLDGARRVVVHLGMTGKLLLMPRSVPIDRHVHVRFSIEGGVELRFQDPRRFGLIDCQLARETAADPRFLLLGPEPLSDACDGVYFYERSRGVRRPIKTFLMDARQVVGVGNIYASEALFAAGIHPRRAAGRLSRAAWNRVASSLKAVLAEAIERGGTTFSDFLDPSGAEGRYRSLLRVYDRSGGSCLRCSGTVRRILLAGRSTFYCTGCQR